MKRRERGSVMTVVVALVVAGLSLSASAAAATPDTIFGSTTPATIDSGDGNSVELGVKFTSEVPGSVTGVRFYKATTNTGTHIGSLWTLAAPCSPRPHSQARRPRAGSRSASQNP